MSLLADFYLYSRSLTLSETELKRVDFSSAKEPAHAIESEADTTAENPNLDRKLEPEKIQDLQEKEQEAIPPGERMIQQTWIRGGGNPQMGKGESWPKNCDRSLTR